MMVNGSLCLLATLTAVTSSKMPVKMNLATNDDFYTSFSNALECAIWQIWHGKVRVRDA